MTHAMRRMAPLLVALVGLASWTHAQRPEVGQPAPVIEGVDQDGQKIGLPPKGHWSVLAFYPKSMTPG